MGLITLEERSGLEPMVNNGITAAVVAGVGGVMNGETLEPVDTRSPPKVCCWLGGGYKSPKVYVCLPRFTFHFQTVCDIIIFRRLSVLQNSHIAPSNAHRLMVLPTGTTARRYLC